MFGCCELHHGEQVPHLHGVLQTLVEEEVEYLLQHLAGGEHRDHVAAAEDGEALVLPQLQLLHQGGHQLATPLLHP